jgi:NAD-dependent SIR2 family protein deacetylase
LDINERIKETANEIRSFDAIAIIGAGVSLGQGFPLTIQLQTFLWQALDADEKTLSALARKFGQDICPAKMLIDDDQYRIRAAFDSIASSSIAWRKFQHNFKNLNEERTSKPSIAHDVIAELLHRRKIKIVISLNWDTLLEASYHKRYGSTLIADGDWLKKPHGDAARPDSKWIYPNERHAANEKKKLKELEKQTKEMKKQTKEIKTN